MSHSDKHSTSGEPRGNASGSAPMPAGVASGEHQGLHQPADDTRIADAVDNVGLSDRGASMEDHLRDRRGKGVRNGFDDAIDHDTDRQFVEDGAIDPGPPAA